MALFRRRRRPDPSPVAPRPQLPPAPPPEPPDRAPWSLRLMSDWAWRLLAVAALVAGILWLLYQVKVVAIAFVIGILLTALLHPFVARLNRLKLPRMLSTAIVFVVGLAVLAGLGVFVGTQVTRNAAALQKQILDVVNTTEKWLANGPLRIDAKQVNDLTSQVSDAISTNWREIATGAVSGLGTTVEIVGGIVLAAFCTFFLLLDGDKMWSWVATRLPQRSRDRMRQAGEVAWRTIGHYVRGTVVIAFTDAVAVTITLLIAQVPLAVPVGVLVFLGAFVPILGLAITGAIAVGLTLIAKGPIAAVVVLIVIVVAVQVEGHVLQPIVMSRAVAVHPLVVVLSVTAGSLIAGIFGAVIAVPLVAVVNNMLTSHVLQFSSPERPRLLRRRTAGKVNG